MIPGRSRIRVAGAAVLPRSNCAIVSCGRDFRVRAGSSQGARGSRAHARRVRESSPIPTETPWRRVVFTADCDEDGNCPVCGIDYGECDRPGPTMDEMEYREIDACYGHAPAREPERRVEPPTCRRRSRSPTRRWPRCWTRQRQSTLRAAALSWKISPANWRSVPRRLAWAASTGSRGRSSTGTSTSLAGTPAAGFSGGLGGSASSGGIRKYSASSNSRDRANRG